MDVNQASNQSNQEKVTTIEFSGKSGEFFGIWIVNILLSIITLGIYSAWATVRTKSYFYGNTKIDGHAFSYLAKPLQILKGRLLAIAFFVVYSIIANFYPLAGIGLAIVLLFLTPWLIIQSLRFSNRMTSYRNVRFDFHGTYGQAFITFILLPILGVLTAYLAMPWVVKKMNQYVLSNTSYGDQQLTTFIETKEYYLAVLYSILVTIVGVGAIAAIIFLATGIASMTALSAISGITGVLLFASYFILMSLINAVYTVKIRNHMFNNTEFENLAKFRSTMTLVPYATLVLTNLLAIVFTLGLAYPWTAIRSSRYAASCTQVKLHENADSVVDTMGEQKSAFGDEAADVFDVGVSAF
ncbi:MAG: hypothetical protein OFPII_16210 [Osedax symbiont Rs1]|nr:MAG: hypothetical protein OFPII_16210 [Osedax symbiont Rs1]